MPLPRADTLSRVARTAPEWGIYIPLLLVLPFVPGLRPEGDSVVLATGAENALRCLAQLKIPCDRGVVHFPLFQYLLAWIALLLGADAGMVPRVLAWWSVAFAVATSALFFQLGRREHGTRGGHAALALLYSGYVVFYFFSSFGEMASFTLFASFCAAVYLGKPRLVVALLALLCTITKETAPPFVLLVFAAAWIAARRPPSPVSWRRLVHAGIPALIGIAAGIGLNAGFNIFRFGSWSNAALLDPAFRTPASAVTAYFAYLFLSPAGGLAYAWLSLCAFTLAAVVAARKQDHALIVVALASLLVIGTNAGLALWFSSFGWYAWGPRLTLPVLGAVCVLLLASSGELLRGLGEPRNRALKGAIVFAVLLASSIPNLLVLVAPADFFSRMFAPTTVTQIFGPDAAILQKAGPELFKFGGMEIYGRPVLPSATIAAGRHNVVVAALCALYCALASWAVCRAREPSSR